ncbi:OLC1v1003675C2 [Oldenlandia corymbosa var. corymbosa]|nr:OLC1v1003675C2 [Oldenlandia corymbosa var. corymbosa]
MLSTSPPLQSIAGRTALTAADVPTLLGTGQFSLLSCDRTSLYKQSRQVPSYLRWPHMQSGQVRGLGLREIGGGFSKHHRAPSIRFACYAVAKPSMMVQKMQNVKKLRGHRDAVYCAIFDRSGRYVITGSDDRLVKIWSVETAFCLASCRGHEGDITDLAVSSNNVLVASASNDYSIRVWRLPDGFPTSVLRGHTGAVTAIAFSPRPSCVYQLLSSSDDGTCRIWDARNSNCSPRIYLPRPIEFISGKTSNLTLSNAASSSNSPPSHQILCCAYNANGTIFVTGSSDTHARVWSAFKSTSDDPEQPSHEIDLLSGHENDVNYVQFSGCAVAPRSSTSEFYTEEGVPKFKNSWFSQDNIVTCSRDGSAIIWTPKSRRIQGKLGRWVRAYHLKVPPPPMPPQPPRGGPRQRFLPTPRGVNMIVWSLDNRFVLAAIMDNRICVWNATDGSLVHSLTGHTASTYVLDVHPFNPRIAMSAGYDGKTIVWDIWEGIPIWTYEIGRFKLVDGKFSQDGTCIVLSDDVGQIYFLNTGQGESQKDAKYDQFFLGDYRPLVRDTHGNALDQETQLVPYQRNIQDPLCDSSMIPYPEPYQSMYQRRRLGALNIEWRPSSIKLAVGPDIGLNQEYQVLPVADLDLVVDPPPELFDAMYWEPENDAIHDETDSEYLVTDECSSEEGQEHSSDGDSSSDPECSEGIKVGRSQKDRLRRSKRKKSLADVDSSTASGRCVKKKINPEAEGPSSRSKRKKKQRNGRKHSLKKKSTEVVKPTRPQRLAVQNAVNGSSYASEFNLDEEEVEESLEFKDDYSSGTNSSLDGANVKTNRVVHHLRKEKQKMKSLSGEQGLSSNWSDNAVKGPAEQRESPQNVGNKKLILKFSLPNLKSSLGKDVREGCNNQVATSSFRQMDLVASDHIGSGYATVENECTNLDADLDTGTPKLSGEGNKGKQVSGVSGAEDAQMSSKLGGIGCDSGLLHNNQNIVRENNVVGLNDIKKPRPTILKIKSRILPQLPPPRKLSPGQSMTDGDESESESSADSFTYSTANQDVSGELPDVATDATRRKRSLRLKATTREPDVMNQKYNINNGYTLLGSLATDTRSRRALNNFPSRGMQMSKPTITLRSSKYKGEGYYNEDRSPLSGRNSLVGLRKSNWLLLTEQEEGFRYIPQLGDEVMYLRQGHQEYMESSQMLQSAPWTRYRNMRAAEACLVDDLEYSAVPGSGESGCKITLRFLDDSSELYGQIFKFTLPELDFPDFIVERTWYKASINRNWACEDKCSVWWRDANEAGGGWWEGEIVLVKDKSSDFPGSPWERYTIRYDSDLESSHLHSPWELHDRANKWDHPCIHPDVRFKLLTSFTKLLDSAGRNQDLYGILKLEEVSQKEDFANKFPVPLSPEVIKLRLDKNYYRKLDALKHDVRVMIANARSYFGKNKELSSKLNRLSDWFDKTFSKF